MSIPRRSAVPVFTKEPLSGGSPPSPGVPRRAPRSLDEALRCGPFHTALRFAIASSGLSLEGVRRRLQTEGHPVSLSALSYWQRGLRRPERAESVRAVLAMERILGLRRSSLVALLGPPRPRGRWSDRTTVLLRFEDALGPESGLDTVLDGLDAGVNASVRHVSMQNDRRLGPDRTWTADRVRRVVTALSDGADRFVALSIPDMTDEHPPTVRPVSGCRLGRIRADALQNGGGPVATNATVFLDFWGSQWDSDANGVVQYMQSLFSGLGGGSDSWSTTMNQYGSSVANPVLGGTWVDDAAPAPASASQADIAAEAQNAASVFGVSGPNVDIFVVSPSGTSPDGFPNTGFCAWHDWNGTSAYTNMPYVLDAGSGCGADSVQSPLDGFSIVGGHEYAEAVTDPVPPSGWVDPSGEEIGDLCAWQNLQAIDLGTGSFAMQPLWSNNDNGCVQ